MSGNLDSTNAHGMAKSIAFQIGRIDSHTLVLF